VPEKVIDCGYTRRTVVVPSLLVDKLLVCGS